MQPREWFEQKSQQFRNDPGYQTELLLLDINEQIVEEMAARGIKRSELARRLGFSRAFVTRLLNGRPNLTLKTLVEVANVLNLAIDVQLKPRYEQMNWRSVDLCTTQQTPSPEVMPGQLGRHDESALAA